MKFKDIVNLIEKIIKITSPVFNAHSAITRDIKTAEREHCFSAGFATAIEQIHLLLLTAKAQAEKGEEVNFDIHKAVAATIAKENEEVSA